MTQVPVAARLPDIGSASTVLTPAQILTVAVPRDDEISDEKKGLI